MAAKTGLTGAAAANGDRYRKRLLGAVGLGGWSSNQNTTITIKSSPPKTANIMTQLAIKCGYVTKRNEQMSWQQRYCVVVPHTFLYYFEDADSETPRGIIDLELYTEMTMQPNNVLKLSTPEGVPLRDFFFKFDTEEEVNAWMSSLVRERFFVVREERDAYQELQNVFQAQSLEMANFMAEQTQAREEAVAEADKLRDDLENVQAAADHKTDFLVEQLHNVLASLGADLAAPPENPRSTEAVSYLAEQAVNAAQRLMGERRHAEEQHEQAEHQLVQKTDEFDQRKALADGQLQRLSEEHASLTDMAEKQGQQLDAQGQQLHALEQELEQYRVNLGIASSNKRSAEAKISELTEQRKLLVKEVRTARKAASVVQQDKAKLSGMVEALEAEVAELKKALEAAADQATNTAALEALATNSQAAKDACVLEGPADMQRVDSSDELTSGDEMPPGPTLRSPVGSTDSLDQLSNGPSDSVLPPIRNLETGQLLPPAHAPTSPTSSDGGEHQPISSRTTDISRLEVLSGRAAKGGTMTANKGWPRVAMGDLSAYRTK